MPKKDASPPAYRRRTIRQRNVAYLTLRDSKTKKARDYWLGDYGSPASRELYARLLAAWEAADRRLPDDDPVERNAEGCTVTQLCHAFWMDNNAKHSDGHVSFLRTTIRQLRAFAGEVPAATFGPNSLRLLRNTMLQADPGVTPPRRAWSRKVCNRFARIVISIWKWGVAHEMVDASVHEALAKLEPLKPGELGSKDRKAVRPVDEEHARAILEHVRSQVGAMIELQLYTGMRPGEVVQMRTCDLDTTGELWVYRPGHHKAEHREIEREILLGPRAKEVVKKWLRPKVEEYLFQPTEAEASRREEQRQLRKSPVQPSQRDRRKADPHRVKGTCYDTDSYRRAITRGCDLAFPPPAPLTKSEHETHKEWRQRLTPEQRRELAKWRKAHRWHPHQLRHTYGTLVRKEYGAEAARVALGHRHVVTTEIYAERDRAVGNDIAAAIG